jgi:GDP-4-dehydro-6-deoxy-D-mannose reductase
LNVLVTGISGFVGCHLVEFIKGFDNSVNIYGTTYGDAANLTSIFGDSLSNNCFDCDLTDKKMTVKVFERSNPDFVIHLAALSSVSDAWSNAEKVLVNNAVSQLNVLEATRMVNPNARILVISSAEVYGKSTPGEMPLTENYDLKPCNPYSVSKVTQEFLALQYYYSYNLKTIIARPFNHIGPRQHGNFVVPSFTRQIALIESGLQEPVMFVGNLTAKRDFTDVRDVVEAYWLLARTGRPGQIYNVASGNAIKIETILHILLEYSKTNILIERDPKLMRPSDVPILEGSFDKIFKEAGWKPKRDIKATLLDTLNYWRKHVSEEMEN